MISWALSFIIMGNGLFKPAPTALISKIFTKSPAKSHAAFTIYYMGVNIGSFLGIVITPIIAKYSGYSSAFWISVLGIIVALLNYKIRSGLLKEVNNSCDLKPINLKTISAIILFAIIQLFICFALFQMADISFYLILALCVITFAYMFKDILSI